MTSVDKFSHAEAIPVNDGSPRRKKDSPAFLHDQNAHIDQKILKLRARGGWAWYGLYWACVETMRACSSLTIEADAVDGLAFSFRLDTQELAQFLNSCVEFKLFALDANGYFSPALNARVDRYENAIEQRRNAGKVSAEKRAKLKDSVSPEIPVQRPFNDRSTTVEPSFNGVTTPVQRPQSNLIQSNLIQSNTIEPNTTEPNTGAQDLDALVESALEHESDPVVQKSNLFLCAGRRPMRKYPDLWLTSGELKQVFDTYEKSGVPRSEFKRGFIACAARLATHKAAGKPLTSVSAFTWLTGFILQEVLDGLKKAVQLETSETYLKAAGAPR